MVPNPDILDEFAAALLEKHEIIVSRQMLEDVFALNSD